MENTSFEIVKQIILNDQLEKPKKLVLQVVEERLSDCDKEQIKCALLKNISQNNYGYPPDELAKLACKAILAIQVYGN
ncbi:hypothetical protein [Testudinibacter sp. TR-2022]|uniref:hypothetical protein n=1 Tax=Testudinibacter sp. TR-2022 TaxID=2585029 RepID=UPI00111BCBC2|nr:hypothetical protein [Testudinibacter sp. TR-2022]TNH06512.1 hypothetical protein FHQ30_07735 [Pasteurellaceae bacterium Phil11]TNH25505.1 hypothetical protein FHQ29_01155 [Testudinibacter sp. TR-2022]TNH28077.1 hypothetical protein FHQ27_03730 [Testudinibacter sp. TR-2022]